MKELFCENFLAFVYCINLFTVQGSHIVCGKRIDVKKALSKTDMAKLGPGSDRQGGGGGRGGGGGGSSGGPWGGAGGGRQGGGGDWNNSNNGYGGGGGSSGWGKYVNYCRK